MGHTIVYKEHIIHYHTYGSGAKVMLAFHGFGQDGTAYKEMADALGQDYTVFSIDLFYHGYSVWNNDDAVMSKGLWNDFIEKFLEEKKIEKFDLAGFSLGAKFALTIVEAFPGRIEELFLIAPDGIKTNGWYSLATYPIGFRKIFKSMIDQPTRFFKLLNMMRKSGIIEKGISKFALSQMGTRAGRSRVYHSWITFSGLKFDMKNIARLINQSNISTHIFLGSHDKIITAGRMQRLLKHLPDYKLIILDSGHNKLIKKVAEHIIIARRTKSF